VVDYIDVGKWWFCGFMTTEVRYIVSNQCVILNFADFANFASA
jgi:hypothetical protein